MSLVLPHQNSLIESATNYLINNPHVARDYVNRTYSAIRDVRDLYQTRVSRNGPGYRRANLRSRVPAGPVRRSGKYIIPSRSGGIYRRKRRVRKMRRVRGIRRRRRYRKGATYKKMLRNIWKELHCPQVLKLTQATEKRSEGCGLRTWLPFYLSSRDDFDNFFARAPTSNFFAAASATPGAASTQKPYGFAKRCHCKGGYFKFILQNRDNWDMDLKVYECMLRKDMPLYVNGALMSNYFGTGKSFSGDQPVSNQGPSPPTYAGGSDLLTTVYQQPTYTPYMSSVFCSDFKILKCHKFNLSPNQYGYLKVRLGRKVLGAEEWSRLSDTNVTGIGRWTKLLLFTWVGGPVDTGLQTDNKQSKGKPTLAIQYDMEWRYYFERTTDSLYTIASSNFGITTRGLDYGSNYDTVSTDTMYVPATCTVQTVAGTAAAAGHGPADNVTENPE